MDAMKGKTKTGGCRDNAMKMMGRSIWTTTTKRKKIDLDEDDEDIIDLDDGSDEEAQEDEEGDVVDPDEL